MRDPVASATTMPVPSLSHDDTRARHAPPPPPPPPPRLSQRGGPCAYAGPGSVDTHLDALRAELASVGEDLLLARSPTAAAAPNNAAPTTAGDRGGGGGGLVAHVNVHAGSDLWSDAASGFAIGPPPPLTTRRLLVVCTQ